MNRDTLVKRFAQAGLVLKLSDKPLSRVVRGGFDIVQIDIQRKINGSRRQEWFTIYPGHEDNRIEVVGTDKRIGQLVLLVHEPAREFEVQLPRHEVGKCRTVEEVAESQHLPVRQVRKVNGEFYRVMKTPSQKRHFLCGLDERQLFIAQLVRAVTTVKEAHDSLKTATVTLAEGNVGKATRQGEWFLLNATDAEKDRITTGLAQNILVVERNVPIGPFIDALGRRFGKKVRQGVGKPHTADELVVLPGDPLAHGFAVRSREVFVRGKVRHADHKTVAFKQWVKVIRNTESNAGSVAGVGWID